MRGGWVIRTKELKNMKQNITNLKDSLFAKLVNFDVCETGDTLCEICAGEGEPNEATHWSMSMDLCYDCYSESAL